jgi:hypothetical protein
MAVRTTKDIGVKDFMAPSSGNVLIPVLMLTSDWMQGIAKTQSMERLPLDGASDNLAKNRHMLKRQPNLIGLASRETHAA